ncbi:phosphoenolpyruvate--protein phosphotransferase [Geomonas paludis]|uniref:phosphoenolpyruvate--protein phosphotransferase n=1 Tax=Geomonas paludis TaxID=2740185 RepID=A0A6V8MWS2_9BACT|nr:phosphoenolpyruvate--protein phosphotransferase [Geomonas paludis]UPU34292.1 phosphoenolpyruvate--protein phosphotransferase [Geomonas paludis]GFO64274.1 phosphoenolpyruvate--protein phosphotransferase [Geomonas paludis]
MPEEAGEQLGLRTLEDISALILQSHDLQETLDNIVNLVAKRMSSDVCSIYLLEEDGETLRLHATRGLSRLSVGITMKISEGLTGLVVEQRGVVATDNAPRHPRYKYFRKTKEEKVLSFLGVPFFERDTPMGVLVIQNREARTFTPQEISAVSTIAWQISSIVSNAKLLDSVRKKEEERAFFAAEVDRLKKSGVLKEGGRPARKSPSSAALTGIGISPGFALGKVSILHHRGPTEEAVLERVRPRAEELNMFQQALEKARIHTIYMEKRMGEILSEADAAIFHSHLMILEDRGFIAKITALIEDGLGAHRAVNQVVEAYVSAFARMEDPYLRERSADMEDIGRRICDALNGHSSHRERLREERIIVARELLPSDLAIMDHGKVIGIATEKGNQNAHSAIMARALGIPAVFGVEGLLQQVGVRSEVVVDGNSGCVYVNPDHSVKQEYVRLQGEFDQKQRALEEIRDLPACTPDGCTVSLLANIGLLSDIKVAHLHGAEGVGLYRTEFPFMTRSSLPTRQVQASVYRKVLEGFPDLPVHIRTLDIGGDKGLSYFPHPKEDNPFLGWRSMRLSLDREDILREQLAAILIASASGKCHLMFPMISGVDEVRRIKAILSQVKDELTREGRSFDPEIGFGVMVELPAAILVIDMLVKEVDYVSIGTNDLIQYTLACDRNNPRVKKWYDPYHPAVLHSIKKVADAAAGAGKPASLCGEMAGEPINAVLLMGLGLRCFSLSAPNIPRVKEAVRRVSLQKAREIGDRVLAMESAQSIREYLEAAQRELGL